MAFIKKEGLTYEKYRDPFFSIKIASEDKTREVTLPHHILRLVTKMEIQETFRPGEFDTITLTFVEGSREPGSPDASIGTKGLYQISKYGEDKANIDIAGSLTNRPGVITDLRFSGRNGITFTTGKERVNQAIDRSKQKNVNNKTVTRAHSNEKSKPLFLFQERNIVTVTWGYRGDNSLQRTIACQIILTSTSFPEGGQVTTTITCQSPGALLNQLTTRKGRNFAKRVSINSSNSIVKFEDEDIESLIKGICEKTGMKCLVSKDILFPIVDKGVSKKWLLGQSFDEFFRYRAEQMNCVYQVIYDPKTKVENLVFIKRSDLENRILMDKNLLTYKAPGSILKSADIRVDFSKTPGWANSGIDREGKQQDVAVKDSQNSQMFVDSRNKQEEVAKLTPENGNKVVDSVAKEISPQGVVGRANSSHLSNEGKEVTADKQADDYSRIIQLDFTTIGHINLSPGTVEVGGLGVRYSGFYRILTTNHVIENGGYVTRCSAESMALNAGGIPNVEALIKKTSNTSIPQTSVSLFDKLKGTKSK